MPSSTITRGYATWVQGASKTVYNNAPGQNGAGDWTWYLGRKHWQYTNDYCAAYVAFTVPSITDSTSAARTLTIPITSTHDYGTKTSLYARLSTTNPGTTLSNFVNGPTSGAVSNEIAWNQDTTTLSFTINSGAAISGKTIYLHLYPKSDASGYTVTVTSVGNGTLSYSCSHSSTSYGGTSGVHTKCNNCGVTVSSSHSYTSSVHTAATCTTKGTTKYTCACGYSYTSQDIPVKSHTSVNGGTSGVHTKCSVCGTTLSSTHSYTSSVQTAATCTVKGTTKYTCSCGYYYTSQDIPATGHSYTATVVAPTCTAQGYTKYKCSKCGDTSKANDTYTAALGHNYVGKVTTEPTYTSEGVKTYTCSRCSASYTESIPKKQGAVYIDDGTGVHAYLAYIDNGSSWDLYLAYIDNGSGWDIHAG